MLITSQVIVLLLLTSCLFYIFKDYLLHDLPFKFSFLERLTHKLFPRLKKANHRNAAFFTTLVDEKLFTITNKGTIYVCIDSVNRFLGYRPIFDWVYSLRDEDIEITFLVLRPHSDEEYKIALKRLRVDLKGSGNFRGYLSAFKSKVKIFTIHDTNPDIMSIMSQLMVVYHPESTRKGMQAFVTEPLKQGQLEGEAEYLFGEEPRLRLLADFIEKQKCTMKLLWDRTPGSRREKLKKIKLSKKQAA